MKYYSR